MRRSRLRQREPAPRATQGHTGSNCITRTDAQGIFFGYNNETTEYGLRRLRLVDDGIVEESIFRDTIGEFHADISFGGGRIYATTGAVIDAKLGARVGALPAAGPIAVDPVNKRVYCWAQRDNKILAFDTETLTKRASAQLPRPGKSPGKKLVVLGGTALAITSERQVTILPLSSLE